MVQKFANGKVKRKKDGNPMTETYVCKKGTVNSKFLNHIISPAVVIQMTSLLCSFP